MLNEQNNSKPQCRVIKGKNGNVQIEIVPEEDALKICPKSYNITVDRLRMKIFVKIGNEKGKEFNGQIKHIDGKPLGLLRKLIQRPARFMTPYEIGNIGEYDVSYFIRDNLIQYSTKLRKHFFGRDGIKIIQTASRPYRLALSSDISFCWIEPIVKPEKDNLPANRQGTN